MKNCVFLILKIYSISIIFMEGKKNPQQKSSAAGVHLNEVSVNKFY